MAQRGNRNGWLFGMVAVFLLSCLSLALSAPLWHHHCEHAEFGKAHTSEQPDREDCTLCSGLVQTISTAPILPPPILLYGVVEHVTFCTTGVAQNTVLDKRGRAPPHGQTLA